MDYLPVFLRLCARPVLVVGGGMVAARKVSLLLEAGAQVTVVAPHLCAELVARAEANEINVRRSEFVPSLVNHQRLIIAAADNDAVNAEVFRCAEQANIPVNAVDDLAHSNCILPAIVDRSPVIVACSTGGSSPVLATELRAQLESVLPARLGALARFARRHRATVKAKISEPATRRRFWLSVMRGEIAARVLANEIDLAEQRLHELLGQTSTNSPHALCLLVAVTSDSADALTLGTLRALFAADGVYVDSDVPREIAAFGRRDAPRSQLARAGSEEEFIESRLTALNDSLTKAEAVVYLSRQPAPWLRALGEKLAERNVLTQFG